MSPAVYEWSAPVNLRGSVYDLEASEAELTQTFCFKNIPVQWDSDVER